jgi:uncharacterized membrane-anchored protein
MNERHVPLLNAKFWIALCIASIFGANLGDFFAHNMGLGHIAGLPFLAAAFALILVVERYDTGVHALYYWLAIVVIRTAATNIGDLLAGDLKLPRPWVMAGLTVLLAITVAVIHRRRQRTAAAAPDLKRKRELLTADGLYWIGMLLAGALGTVLGDYVSHNLRLGDLVASVALGVPLAVLFIVGSRGPIWWVPFFWLTVVTVRADGTVVGDWFAGHTMLGLPLSTAVTGLVLVAFLLVWRDRPLRPIRV